MFPAKQIDTSEPLEFFSADLTALGALFRLLEVKGVRLCRHGHAANRQTLLPAFTVKEGSSDVPQIRFSEPDQFGVRSSPSLLRLAPSSHSLPSITREQ